MEMIDHAGRGGGSRVRIHSELLQGTDEWLEARCGMLTASEMKLIVTPTFKKASNEKERAHLYELLAQRITNFVEPTYVSDDMLRGRDDEVEALLLYDKHFERVERVGFITNDKWGFTLGYSPDALVGRDGQVECKSRRQKYQVETFVLHVIEETIPADFLIQVQTGLAVSERLWCDFVSYSGGMPLARIRAYPDPVVQDAIISAAGDFEKRLLDARDRYLDAVASSRAIPTKRINREILV
ncbi:YqaJ viral recombinase family protein [Methylobacterium brachythecii]|uniref:YqaJ viral recombinase domain-containing protein n=1 Tax=Methylobacterium brachythecii TaxID=1176177 RepID=A0A7W6F9E6_9HYPH|nr:YqaJ viral recombinase family protein [Methylobacterium brachythecii]MBB3905076.1 hypothetical protein [Methylobacterium brachythecii]GLS44416.1 hypothetical protein GCM10007884_24040 [Methylobacterium brachythecii]